MGYVADIFDRAVLGELPGPVAVGHVRYATAGNSTLANAQPVVAKTHRGQMALAHNGNLVNALRLRRELERQGAIFQSTSDSEVFLHLLARSRAATLEGALARGRWTPPSAPGRSPCWWTAGCSRRATRTVSDPWSSVVSARRGSWRRRPARST